MTTVATINKKHTDRMSSVLEKLNEIIERSKTTQMQRLMEKIISVESAIADAEAAMPPEAAVTAQAGRSMLRM